MVREKSENSWGERIAARPLHLSIQMQGGHPPAPPVLVYMYCVSLLCMREGALLHELIFVRSRALNFVMLAPSRDDPDLDKTYFMKFTYMSKMLFVFEWFLLDYCMR